MIDSGLRVEYLKPELWTNLGTLIAPLMHRGKVLHILRRENGRFRGVTSEQKTFPLNLYLDGEDLNIKSIFKENSDIIEIRVYTAPGLISYYKEIQKHQVYQKDIDDYLTDLYRVQENTEGIRIYKKNDNKKRCGMELIKSFAGSGIGDDVVFIWLTDKDRLYFNCILEFSCGKLKCVSTSDRYAQAEEKYEVILSLIQNEYRRKVIPVRMELDEYIGIFAEI